MAEERAVLTKADIEQLVAAMSHEDVDAAADKVLFNTNSAVVTIEGKKLTISPLPVSAAKRLAAYVKEAVSNIEKARLSPSHTADELDAATTVTLAATVLLNHYHFEPGTTFTVEQVEDRFQLGELQLLVHAQMKISDENDFLLLPLRSVIMAITTGKNMMTAIKKQLFTKAFASVGASLSENLSNTTP